jgi:hypothetical protein
VATKTVGATVELSEINQPTYYAITKKDITVTFDDNGNG